MPILVIEEPGMTRRDNRPQHYCIEICWMQRYITNLCERKVFTANHFFGSFRFEKRPEIIVGSKDDQELLKGING